MARRTASSGVPHAPNIHYFGQHPYDFLPGLLASWDVCLLPFARNESTRYISPTKTLEYLAADKPVVSTGIADVIELYGSAVRIANTPEELVREVDSLLGETAMEREERVAKGRELVRQSSWDATASYMRSTLEEALPQGLKPDVALFELPKGFSQYDNVQDMMMSSMQRMIKGGRE